MILKEKHIVVYLGTHELIASLAILDKDPTLLKQIIRRYPEGFKKGFVTNLERASNVIEGLLDELLAEEASLIRAKGCYPVHLVLGNPKIQTFTYSSSQFYQGAPRDITNFDVQTVIEQTRSVATLPLSEFVLQVIPVSFLVNDLEGVIDPIGLEAQRLGVTLKMFTMGFEDFRNIAKAFELADVEVTGFYPRTLASSEAVLSAQEKDEGVLLIDIGHEVTFLSHWKKGELVQSQVLNVGDYYLCQRIADEWELDISDAEKIKDQYGALDPSLQFAGELIPFVSGGSSTNVQRQIFHQKFMEQAKDWLEIILRASQEFARQERFYHPHFVFCGSGSGIDGFLEFLQRNLQISGRIGHTRGLDAPHEMLVNPSLAPSLGILNWLTSEDKVKADMAKPSSIFRKTISTAKNWFSTYF